MTRSSTSELLHPHSEPEHKLKRKKPKKEKKIKIMEDDQPMWSIRQKAPETPVSAIIKHAIQGENFEIKGQILHMIRDLQFDGKLVNDPNLHVEIFLDICELFKNQASNDAVRLRIFPFTLTGEAKAWLKSLEPNSITNWEELRSKFVTRYYPPSKAEKLKNDIIGFQQNHDENLAEAWERMKKLIRICPNNGLTRAQIVQIFYRGVDSTSRATLDSSSGGVFLYKTPNEAYKLLEDMSIHNLDWNLDKRSISRQTLKHVQNNDNEEVAVLKNNQKVLERKIEALTVSLHAV